MASISLDIQSQLPRAIKWTDAHTKQLPFSVSQALNATSKGLRQLPGSNQRSILRDLQRLSERQLDRPKAATASGYFATTANKRNLEVLIAPKNKPWDRARYLVGNIKGGSRPLKGYDRVFASRGELPNGSRLVPTRNVKRDRYGNPRRALVSKLISGTALPPGTRGAVFVGKPPNSSKPFGVYQTQTRGQLRAMFIAKPDTNYPSPLRNVPRYAAARANQTFGPYLRKLLDINVRNELGGK